MKRPKLVLVALLVIITGMYSCTKTGSAGATGATGAKGTANVLYSNWNALKMTFNSTDSAYEQTITADSITQAVLDSGLVLCYIKYTNATNQVQVESASTYMEEVFGLQSITLYSYNFDYTGVSFRYLIIHGGTSVNGRLANAATLIQGHTKAEWKAMTYDQVTALLNQ